jgi:hypothetical protein
MTAGTSLDGRRFASAVNVVEGEVSADTVFTYKEAADGTVTATYSGGSIRSGFLVGTRTGAELDFRYVQLNMQRETSTGHCRSSIERLPEGRLQLREVWRWESRDGSGTSVVTELPDSPAYASDAALSTR